MDTVARPQGRRRPHSRAGSRPLGVPVTTLSILPADLQALPFLGAMLYEAAFWRPGSPRPPPEEALGDPTLAVYLEGWGRPGDHGLVAHVRGSPVGAVWVRHFDEHRHGYGFVDADTPELTIAVSPASRRRGLARCLLSAIIAEQRLAGTRRLSLSVEDDNPARTLYEQHGFVTHDAAEGARTMIRPLHRATGPHRATGG